MEYCHFSISNFVQDARDYRWRRGSSASARNLPSNCNTPLEIPRAPSRTKWHSAYLEESKKSECWQYQPWKFIRDKDTVRVSLRRNTLLFRGQIRRKLLPKTSTILGISNQMYFATFLLPLLECTDPVA